MTNLVRDGNDIVLVAELAGQRRLETTRRYILPSAADRQGVAALRHKQQGVPRSTGSMPLFFTQIE